MKQKSVLFDLDGTLTDSGEGIINCAVYALEQLGLPVPPRDAMGVFVGPPLWDTFEKFGVPKDKTDEAVRIFRSRYVPVGKFENTPYPGIGELLARKNYYFVPYGQDDSEKKPTSLVAHFEMIPATVDAAVLGKQIQPLIQ